MTINRHIQVTETFDLFDYLANSCGKTLAEILEELELNVPMSAWLDVDIDYETQVRRMNLVSQRIGGDSE